MTEIHDSTQYLRKFITLTLGPSSFYKHLVLCKKKTSTLQRPNYIHFNICVFNNSMKTTSIEQIAITAFRLWYVCKYHNILLTTLSLSGCVSLTKSGESFSPASCPFNFIIQTIQLVGSSKTLLLES